MEQRTTTEKCELIARSFLFQGISDQHLEHLARYSKIKQIAARKVICQRGEQGSQMFIIVSGRVSMNTDSEEGKELTFGILGPGDIFGEIALLDGGERTATVKTIEATEVLMLERRDFLPFLEKFPKVAISLLSTLAARLRKTDELFEDTYFKNLPGRLAKRFLGLADTYGSPTSHGIQIDVKLSQGDIGKLAGATRESINKQLKAWEEDGLISFDKGYIVLKELEKLEDICEF